MKTALERSNEVLSNELIMSSVMSSVNYVKCYESSIQFLVYMCLLKYISSTLKNVPFFSYEHTYIFAKNGKLHKFATINDNFEKNDYF